MPHSPVRSGSCAVVDGRRRFECPVGPSTPTIVTWAELHFYDLPLIRPSGFVNSASLVRSYRPIMQNWQLPRGSQLPVGPSSVPYFLLDQLNLAESRYAS